jgi:hypothetical protein
MKKNFITYTLFLTIASFGSFYVQAQEQKKPSERSFTDEIKKVKQIQTTRNTMVRQMPQPAENIPVVSDTGKQVTNEGGSNQSGNTNSTTTKEKTQQEVTIPSAAPMKQPRKPIIPKGK